MTAGTARRRRLGAALRARVAVGALVVVATALAACSSSGAPGAAAEGGAVPPPTIPLVSSSTGPAVGWAVFPMGNLAEPRNSFWQLFYLTGSPSHWELSTPPGVASNGGLMVSVPVPVPVSAPARVLAGFGPSQDLRFSPLALTSDAGTSWVPGVLPGALARVPDALAASGYGQDLALLAGGSPVTTPGLHGGGVVAGSDADPTVWHAVVSTRALAVDPATRSCRIFRVTAVTFAAGSPAGAAGDPTIGAACAHGGRPGIFSEVDHRWTSSGPAVPGVEGGPTEVLRLVDTAAGTAALVRVGSGSTSRLVALWSTDGLTHWTVSAGLSLDGHALVASGVTPAGGFVVTSRTPGGGRAASVITPSTGPWRGLAPPPSGTATVAATTAGGFDALVPEKTTLSVYALGSDGWTRSQKLSVPIQYGSSG